jgi:hypothetical protein
VPFGFVYPRIRPFFLSHQSTTFDYISARSGEPFAVRDIDVDVPTSEEDGTTIEITDFNVKRPDVDKVISYVERHLSRYPQRAHVTISGHECKFEEPSFIERFDRFPSPEVATHIGNVPLIVKIAPIPLDEETRGIDVLSNGIWHGTTLGDIAKKEHANQIFGQIDVPILEDGEWPVPPFDNTRNNTLNPQNPVVAVLLGWLSEELEQIRLGLVEKERVRRRSEIAKQLAKEAQRIAEILNEDFLQMDMELELTRKVSKRSGGKSVDEIPDQQGELWPGGGDQPTSWQRTGPPHGSGSRGDLAGTGSVPRPGPTARSGNELGSPQTTVDGPSKKRRAVFSIDYEHVGVSSHRSRYDRETKTIFINLDHPQVGGAFDAGGGQTDARQFREMCYEVAAVEYALALQYEKVEQEELSDAAEALYDVRETINRISRRFMERL